MCKISQKMKHDIQKCFKIIKSHTNIRQDTRTNWETKPRMNRSHRLSGKSSVTGCWKWSREVHFLGDIFNIINLACFLHLRIQIYNFNDQKRCELVSDKWRNCTTLWGCRMPTWFGTLRSQTDCKSLPAILKHVWFFTWWEEAGVKDLH